ncbi:MAG: cytochrome P460 family protein [Pseudomonadota bacterium]
MSVARKVFLEILRAATAGLGIAAFAALVSPLYGQADEVIYSTISGDPEAPRRHFRVKNPAKLTMEEAGEIYRNLAGDMALGFAASGYETAQGYQGWLPASLAPYRSATHGQRYANNYVNSVAQAYLQYEQAGRLPVGSLLAKDSFTVTADGKVEPGPLFTMEKMPPGFSYVSGDWRYAMVMPDGTLFGETRGQGAERVKYCIDCHLAQEDQDHLFFVPEPYRITLDQ